MSLLGTPVYANDSTPLWLSASPGGPGGNATFASVTTTGPMAVGTNITVDSAAYFLDASNNPTCAINNNSGVLALSGTNAIDFKVVGAVGGNSSITLRPLGGQDILTTGLVDCDGIVLPTTGGAPTIGSATLVGGTITVTTTASDVTSYIMLTRTAVNSSTSLGELRVSNKSANQFTVVSATIGTPATTETGDLSTFDWVVFNPT